MLVFSRKKNEAVLIDGVIRVQVVGLSKAMVRIRILAPRELVIDAPAGGKARSARRESAFAAGPAGGGCSELTLLSQQTIGIGPTLQLGVVDVDRSRALLFLDAPPGTTVSTTADPEAGPGASPISQTLLQFMAPGGEPAERAGKAPGPSVLPFPSTGPSQKSP